MHTEVPDFSIASRIESTLKWIEAFNVESRWEWLNSSRASWQDSGARWFRAWLRGLESLARAWRSGHLSPEHERRVRELLCKHGTTVIALQNRTFKVHPAVLEAVRRCA
jgi:hypothetical protein